MEKTFVLELVIYLSLPHCPPSCARGKLSLTPPSRAQASCKVNPPPLNQYNTKRYIHQYTVNLEFIFGLTPPCLVRLAKIH